MTETFLGAGRAMLSEMRGASGHAAVAGAGFCAEGGSAENVLIDQLIDHVLALEPLELKQQDAVAEDGAGPPAADGNRAASTLLTGSTQRMLMHMRAVLDREAARLGTEGAEGKAAVDQVALIARTLEKIDQMERLIAQDQAGAARQGLSADEREQLRQTVRQLILAAAERLALERAGEQTAQGQSGQVPGGPETAAR
ncbi:hypothetical protein [uncultured Hoeflea sp.]|uniref:hypothetical protein n=1 Tax=uncultured Hoeflea sp. TaxID=538666 RepID=UPI0030D7D68F|tara:strand:+ start:204 stop:797 length:594 start_codon:yes stop_codon:yes gene_type:complete